MVEEAKENPDPYSVVLLMSLETQITWFKAHERLVLLLVVSAVGIYGYNKYLDYSISRDKNQAMIANQQAQVSAQAFTQSQAQTQVVLGQLAALQQQILDQNKRIDQAMQQRAQATDAQKKKNDQSNSAEVAARIVQLLRVQPQEVTASSVDGTVVFSASAAHTDVNTLEDGAKAQADVKDLSTELASCKTQVSQQEIAIQDEQETNIAGVKALDDEKKAHAKDVATLNQEKKKAWLNGFKWGSIAGFVGGLFVPKPKS